MNQTIIPDEIIVVDDASTDNTLETVKNYILETNNTIIKVIALIQNSGAQHARNVGIKTAKSDWIAFIDADDEWFPQKLAKQIEAIKNSGRIVCSTGCMVNDKSVDHEWISDVSSGFIFGEICTINQYIMFQSLVVKKVALEKIGYLDEDVPAYQELDTALSLSKQYEVECVNEPLFRYYVRKDSMFRKRDRSIAGREYVYKKWKKDIITYADKGALARWYAALYSEYSYVSFKKYFYAFRCIIEKLRLEIKRN